MAVRLRGHSFWAVPFFLLLFCSSLQAQKKNPTAVSLTTLAEEPYWQSLLHYKNGLSGRLSTIDDDKFFLSEQGSTNPLAELTATISAFSKGSAQELKHPINRFPARLKWLQSKLPKLSKKFIAQKSLLFEKVWDSIDPQSASVIFPTQYMNNPASLFGHTLINIDGKRKNKLLAYSINYSAITSEDNGIAFAFNGIFGNYKGKFSIGPYYEKVKEYSDLSMRDIWEYRLNFTQEELRNLMLHLWELQDVYSYYYFFDENCSFNILFLLDIARPGSKIISKFNGWIIPVDTIKEIKKNKFIAEARYRPSRSTKIKRIAASLPYDLQKKSITAIKSNDGYKELTAGIGSKEDKIRLLDLSTELLKMNYNDGKVDKKDYTKRYLGLLRQRAKLGKVDKDFYPNITPSQPEKGHDSLRLTLGGGSFNGDPYTSIGWRPAYHDLLDPSVGYQQGSSIEFLSSEFYYFSDERKLELQQLGLISIHSFSPMDAFFQSKSWKVNTGFKTIRDRDDDDKRHLAYYFNSGIGASFRPLEKHILYLLAEPALLINRSLDHNYMLGLGAVTGLLSEWSDNWRSHLELRRRYTMFGQENNLTEFSSKISYTLSQNSAIQIFWKRSQELQQSWSESGINLQLFF